jgi:hypothetical protein
MLFLFPFYLFPFLSSPAIIPRAGLLDCLQAILLKGITLGCSSSLELPLTVVDNPWILLRRLNQTIADSL